jgi:hypothetical protein
MVPEIRYRISAQLIRSAYPSVRLEVTGKFTRAGIGIHAHLFRIEPYIYRLSHLGHRYGLIHETYHPYIRIYVTV